MVELEHALAVHPFLVGIPKSKLDVLAACAREVTFAPGQWIVDEAEPARTFYLLESGRAAIEIDVAGTPHTLQTLREGDVLGVSWLFPPYRWQFSARALQPMSALSFDGEAVRREMDLDHELGYVLLHRFAAVINGRLQAARMQLLDLYGGGPG